MILPRSLLKKKVPNCIPSPILSLIRNQKKRAKEVEKDRNQ